MKKRPFRVAKLFLPVLTSMLIVALFVIYEFGWVSRRQAYFNERAFRALDVIGLRLVDLLNGLNNIVAASTYPTTLDIKSPAKPDEYVRKVLRLSAGDIANATSNTSHRDRNVPISEYRVATRGTFRLATVPERSGLWVRVQYTEPPDSDKDRAHRSLPERAAPRSSTSPAATGECSDRRGTIYSCLDVNLGPLVATLTDSLSQDIFDDILITTSSGRILFQRGPAPLRATHLAAWTREADVQPKAASNTSSKEPADAARKAGADVASLSALEASTRRTIEVGEAKYLLYIQPTSYTMAGPERLVVAGLRDVAAAEAQALTVPYNIVVWLSLALLALFTFSWPILKISYMSEAERLQHKHIVTLVATVVWATALSTAIVLWAAYQWRGRNRDADRLATLARVVEQNLRHELSRALSVLDRASENLYPDKPWQVTQVFTTSQLRTYQGLVYSYPYFKYLFWADENGKQTHKLTTDEQGTPQRSIEDSDYFHRAKDYARLGAPDSLWQIPREAGSNGKFSFWLEPLRSPSTDEFLVVLATAERQDTIADSGRSRQGLVKVLAVRLESLWEPVLPPGYGFAIIDSQGAVKFHSNPARNLVEDFGKETQSDRTIAGLIRQRATGIVRTSYMGHPEVVRVSPLALITGADWYLLTFRDVGDEDAIGVAVVASPLWIFGVPLGIGALLALVLLRNVAYPLQWIWPDRRAGPRYWRTGLFNLMLLITALNGFGTRPLFTDAVITAIAITLSAAFWLVARRDCPKAIVPEVPGVIVLGCLVRGTPAISVLAVYAVLLLAMARSNWESWIRRISGATLYPFAAASMLLVLVALPMTVAFKGTVESVERLALMRQQLFVASSLARRETRIRDYYRRLELPALAGRRLDETIDRYDYPLVHTEQPALAARRNASPVCLTLVGCRVTTEDVRWLFDRFIGSTVETIARSEAGSDLGVLSRIDPTRAAPMSPTWTRVGTRRSDGGLVVMQATPAVGPPIRIVSRFRRWDGLGRAESAGITLIWVGVGFWFFFIARRLFFTKYTSVPPYERWSSSTLPKHHAIVIGPPRSGKRHFIGSFPNHATLLDVRTLATHDGEWTLRDDTLDVVALQHFDFEIDIPEANRRRLGLLEKLMVEHGKTVILLTSVDVMYYFASGFPQTMVADPARTDEAMQLLDRWSAVLSRFNTITLDDRSVKPFAAFIERLRVHPYWRARPEALERCRMECDRTPFLRHLGRRLLKQQVGTAHLKPEQLTEIIADRANTYYRAMWASCTKHERLALFQLAADGWMNPKNLVAIQQLHRRQLITFDRGFQIMNESFRRFVGSSQYPNEVAEWEVDERQSVWRAMRLSLGIAGALGVFWLVYAQQEFLDSSLAYIGGSVTALSAVLKLMGDLRQRSRAPKTGT